MTTAALIAAMDLPAASRLDKRVSKTLLIEHGAPTPADRRHVQEAVDSLTWLAVLKPSTVGVPAFRDEVREYLEIVVLHLALRTSTSAAAAARLTELVHRAVPYPVILCVDNAQEMSMSAAHKRWSQGESGKTVLDGNVMSVSWTSAGCDLTPAECQAMALSRLPHESMYALYDGWLDAIAAIRASRIAGEVSPLTSAERAADRRLALGEWEELEREISQIRSAARRETQMARQVDLNIKLKALQTRQAAVRERLR